MTDFIARIKPKKSTVSGEVPAPADLEVSEIAVNTADGVLFTKHSDGTIKSISGGGGGSGGGTIESIGNVDPRLIPSPSVPSWTGDDEAVSGGWSFSGNTVTLNQEDSSGSDIRTYVLTLSTSGTFWWSNDGISYSTTEYSSLSINAEGRVFFEVVELASLQDPGTFYAAWEDPFVAGPSFEGDVLIYDAAAGVWRPSSPTVSSVNGETGAVSLGITQMDDFELRPDLAGASVINFTCKDGYTAVGSYTIEVADYDCNGRNYFTYLDTSVLDQQVNTLYYRNSENEEWSSFTQVRISSDESIRFNTPEDRTAWMAADPNYFSINVIPDDFLEIPLTNGDVLRYNESSQKFNPAPAKDRIQEMDDFELNLLGEAGAGGVRVKISPFVGNSNGFSQENNNFIIDHVNATGLDEYQNGGWVSQIAQGKQIFVIDSQGNQSTTSIVYEPTVDTSSQYGPRTYFAVDSTFQAAIAALPDGEEVTISLDAPYVPARAPLAEGDILQWNDADQKFNPAPAKDRIQEMDDFELVPGLATGGELYDSKVGDQNPSGDGEWYWGYSSRGWIDIAPNDADGNPRSEVMGLSGGDTIYISKDGGSWAGYELHSDGVLASGRIYLETDYPSTEFDGVSAIRVSATDLGTPTPQALAEGDILQWNDADQKFKPARASEVDSVNGEIGDISLGVQDMDDFSLNGEAGDIPLQDGQILQWVDADQKFKPTTIAVDKSLGELTDVDTITTPPTDGQALIWDNANAEWKPGSVTGGGGGAVDSVNGQTGTVVINMDDIENVDSLVEISGVYQTNFEELEPFPQDPTPAGESVVTYEGQRSVRFDNAESLYGQGNHLKNVFPGNDSSLRYDVVRQYVRSDAAFDTSNRQSLGGTKAGIETGGGWTIYTRDTGFSFYANGNYFEDGTKPSMVADTWYEIVYVIDWENGRNVIPARWSLWVDGAIAVDSSDPGANAVTYAQPVAPDDTRYYFASSPATGTGLRYVDKLSVKGTDTLPWGMSDLTLDVNDITPFFAQSFSSTPDGHILRYNGTEQKWKTLEFNFENVPQAGYNLFDADGDSTKPYANLNPTSLGSINFSAYTTKEEERSAVYANQAYGMTIGKYHLDLADGGTITDDRRRADEARRTYYSDNGIIHNMGDKPLWLMGALATYTDNTPELRWTSGNPGDISNSNNGNYIGLKLPADISVDTTYTFPKDIGAGGYLTTDGAGNLTWGDPIGSVSPGYTFDSTWFFNYENDDEDYQAVDPALLSTTDPKIGTSNLKLNVVQTDAQNVEGVWPVSPFGDTNFIGTRAFTFQTWFKNLNPELPGNLARYHRMISSRSTDTSLSNQANGFQIRTWGGAGSGDGPQGALELSSDEIIIRGETVVTDQDWHHLVVQHDGFGNYWMFLDGVLDKFVARGSAYLFINLDGWHLGARNDKGANSFWMGELDATELLVGTALYPTAGFTPPTTPAGGESITVVEQTQLRLAVISDVSDVDTVTTPPADGQALVWDESEGAWVPGSVASGGGGAVDSVNGETGVVSLGIQEMDDFELNESASSDGPWSTSESAVNLPGHWREAADSTNRWVFWNHQQDDGTDVSAPYLALVDGDAILLSGDNVNWYTFTLEGPATNNQGYEVLIKTVEDPSIVKTFSTLYVALSAFDVPLAEGDILQWNDADQKFKPAQLSSDAVDSVNTQTGVVSLGVFDLNDVEKVPNIATTTFFYDKGDCSLPSGSGSDWADGSIRTISNVDGHLLATDNDANGEDFRSVVAAKVAAVGLPLTFWTSADGANNWTEYTTSTDPTSNSERLDFMNASFGTCTRPIYITLEDPAGNDPVIEPVEGDILQWNDADQKFRPAQLPAGGGAVDSVNGETGVVEIGVEQLDNFALKLVPGVGSYDGNTSYRTSGWTGAPAGSWTIGNPSAGAFFQYQDAQASAMDLFVSGTAVTFTAEGVSPHSVTSTSNPDETGIDGSRYFRVSSDWPDEWLNLPDGTACLVSSDILPGNSYIPVANGDILVYSAAAQEWNPQQPSGGGGAVDSVNGETGIVSLGIQDMDDFELNSYPSVIVSLTTLSGSCSADGQFGTPVNNNGFVGDFFLYYGGGNDYVQFSKLTAGDPITFTFDDGSQHATTFVQTAVNGGSEWYMSIATDWPAQAFVTQTIDVSSPAFGAYTFTPLAEGDILQWNDADQEFKPAQVHAGPTRVQELVITSPLAQNASESVAAGIGKSGTFVKVQASHAAWITFYATEASRDADASRDQVTAPGRGSGVLLEVLAEASESYLVTPAVSFFNAEDSPSSEIPMRVVSRTDGTTPITVTIEAITLEP